MSDDVDRELLDMLKAPIRAAAEQAERIKAAAEKFKEAAKKSTLARVAAMLSGTPPVKIDKALREAALEVLAAVDDVPEIAALRREMEPEREHLVAADEAEKTQPATGPAADTKVGDMEADDAAADTVSPTEYPRLRTLCRTKPVLLIAGVSQTQERIGWLKRMLGDKVEWRSVVIGGRVEGEVARARRGGFSGVVMFQQLLSKGQTESLIAACDYSGTPHAFAGKPGKGSIAAALAQIEGALARKECS